MTEQRHIDKAARYAPGLTGSDPEYWAHEEEFEAILKDLPEEMQRLTEMVGKQPHAWLTYQIRQVWKLAEKQRETYHDLDGNRTKLALRLRDILDSIDDLNAKYAKEETP